MKVLCCFSLPPSNHTQDSQTNYLTVKRTNNFVTKEAIVWSINYYGVFLKKYVTLEHSCKVSTSVEHSLSSTLSGPQRQYLSHTDQRLGLATEKMAFRHFSIL
jgi:hypothetical protein